MTLGLGSTWDMMSQGQENQFISVSYSMHIPDPICLVLSLLIHWFRGYMHTKEGTGLSSGKNGQMWSGLYYGWKGRLNLKSKEMLNVRRERVTRRHVDVNARQVSVSSRLMNSILIKTDTNGRFPSHPSFWFPWLMIHSLTAKKISSTLAFFSFNLELLETFLQLYVSFV